MKDFTKECPKCGGGPVYQDRIDARRNVAHCDDCGEELTAEEYAQICVEPQVKDAPEADSESRCECADHQGGPCSFCMEAKYNL